MFRDLSFDDTTRIRLSALLRDALTGKDFFPNSLDDEVEIMLRIMEGYAEAIPIFKEFEPESQQRRRERIASLAAHLEGAIEQLKQLDTGALGYVAWRGFEEASKAAGVPNSFPQGMDAVFEAEALRDENIPTITAFALGVRKAAADLPEHPLNSSGKNYPLWALPKELSTAMAIENLFWKYKIKFTVSNSGLAAECLRAVYTLGGLNIDRVNYWLKQARDHFDSNHSYFERRQKRTDE